MVWCGVLRGGRGLWVRVLVSLHSKRFLMVGRAAFEKLVRKVEPGGKLSGLGSWLGFGVTSCTFGVEGCLKDEPPAS